MRPSPKNKVHFTFYINVKIKLTCLVCIDTKLYKTFKSLQPQLLTVNPNFYPFAHVHQPHFTTIQNYFLRCLAHAVNSLLVDEDVFGARVAEKLMVMVVDSDEADNLRLNGVGAAIDNQQAVILVLCLVARFDWGQIAVVT